MPDDAVYAPLFLDPELFGVNRRFENVKFRGIEWWEDVIYWHVPEDRHQSIRPLNDERRRVGTWLPDP